MSNVPPPYATGLEQKGFIPPDQQQQPVGYYPPQPQPGPTAPPGQTVTYYPPAGPPQQQPQQLVITQPAPVIVGQTQPVKSYVLHIVLSAVVFFCCYGLLGLIAFICAIVAQSRAAHSPESARSCGKASIVLSVIAIVLGIVITVIFLVLQLMTIKTSTDYASDVMTALKCPHRANNGRCFRYKTYASTAIACMGHYESPYCYTSEM